MLEPEPAPFRHHGLLRDLSPAGAEPAQYLRIVWVKWAVPSGRHRFFPFLTAPLGPGSAKAPHRVDSAAPIIAFRCLMHKEWVPLSAGRRPASGARRLSCDCQPQTSLRLPPIGGEVRPYTSRLAATLSWHLGPGWHPQTCFWGVGAHGMRPYRNRLCGVREM